MTSSLRLGKVFLCHVQTNTGIRVRYIAPTIHLQQLHLVQIQTHDTQKSLQAFLNERDSLPLWFQRPPDWPVLKNEFSKRESNDRIRCQGFLHWTIGYPLAFVCFFKWSESTLASWYIQDFAVTCQDVARPVNPSNKWCNLWCWRFTSGCPHDVTSRKWTVKVAHQTNSK